MNERDLLPDPSDQLPEPWEKLLSEIQNAGGAPNAREAAKTRVDVWLLLTELRIRLQIAEAEAERARADERAAQARAYVARIQADAALDLSASMKRATWCDRTLKMRTRASLTVRT